MYITFVICTWWAKKYMVESKISLKFAHETGIVNGLSLHVQQIKLLLFLLKIIWSCVGFNSSKLNKCNEWCMRLGQRLKSHCSNFQVPTLIVAISVFLSVLISFSSYFIIFIFFYFCSYPIVVFLFIWELWEECTWFDAIRVSDVWLFLRNHSSYVHVLSF